MELLETSYGPVKILTAEETQVKFVPLRDRIFDPAGGLSLTGDPILREPSWTKVIIRGSLWYSERSEPPVEPYEDLDAWARDDPRDELLPLFELLVEDGISEVIHMSSYTIGGRLDAVITRPTRSACYYSNPRVQSVCSSDRLLFDETGRWGFYGSEEMFGLLGGEPAFMQLYIERVGGMDFIRKNADSYWQAVVDEDSFEAEWVPHYYKLAGWDNPPRGREG